MLKVKTIVTLVVIAVFAYLSVTGKIDVDNVMLIVAMVVSFYFGTQHERKVGHETTADATAVPEMKAE
mgnify:CR=1 FL=1